MYILANIVKQKINADIERWLLLMRNAKFYLI